MYRGHLRGVKVSKCLVKSGSGVHGKNKAKPCLQALGIEPCTHLGTLLVLDPKQVDVGFNPACPPARLDFKKVLLDLGCY